MKNRARLGGSITPRAVRLLIGTVDGLRAKCQKSSATQRRKDEKHTVECFFKPAIVAHLAIAMFWALFGASAATAKCATGNAEGIFYLTDRAAVKGEQFFSGERAIGSDRLAMVQRGMLGSPISARRRSDCGSQGEFFSSIGKSFDSKRGRQVLIYVPGYYTSFIAAAGSALKLRSALGFPGPVVLYSWPSKVTSRLSYVNDETNASWSFVQFRAFLGQLETKYPGTRISFAAHSLGARFVADGISYLRNSRCSKCLGRVALFAPDVDAATLYAEFSADKFCSGPPKLKQVVSAAVVLYVSNKDVALRQSQQFHGHQRAGQAGNEILLCDGIDTVDVRLFKVLRSFKPQLSRRRPRTKGCARSACRRIPHCSIAQIDKGNTLRRRIL